MTNGERADRLLNEAGRVAGEMRRSLLEQDWNLALRRAQEVVELVVKGVLNEMSVDYPRTHDPAPLLVDALQRRGIAADGEFLTELVRLSAHLAELRSPAFYQEIIVTEVEARSNVAGVERGTRSPSVPFVSRMMTRP